MIDPSRARTLVRSCVAPGLAWALFAAGLSSCDDGKTGAEPASANQGVFTERRELNAAGPGQLKLGEDCSQTGKAGCQSGLCLKHRPGFGTGYVCSAPCDTVANCPATWACNSMYPAPKASYCTPPAAWVYGATTVRPASAGQVAGGGPPPSLVRDSGVSAATDGGTP
jgi:hypothetical protein